MTTRWVVTLTALVGLAAFYLAMKPAGNVYPHAGAYAFIRGNGNPFVAGGVIDTAKVYRLARYNRIVIDPARVGRNAEIEALLRNEQRRLDPKSTILAFVPTGKFFVCGVGWVGGEIPYGCDTTANSNAWSRWRAIRAHDAVLWSTSGAPYLGGGFVDFAKAGIAVALADTALAWLPKGWTGIFSDELCASGWIPGGDTIDVARSGYASLAEWRDGYRAGVVAYYQRLREGLPTGVIVGNCGPEGTAIASGWLQENFPFQPGSTVASFIKAETTYAVPRQSWRNAWLDGPDTSAANRKLARYACGVASLGDGVAAFVWSADFGDRGWVDGWTIGPEWEPRSWGRAKGKAYQSGGLWKREFQRGTLTVNEAIRDASFERGTP